MRNNETKFVNQVITGIETAEKTALTVPVAAIQTAIAEQQAQASRAQVERARYLLEKLTNTVNRRVSRLREIREMEKQARQEVLNASRAFKVFQETGDLQKTAEAFYPGDKTAQDNFVRNWS